ncbi:MAG: histidine kinase dimerization/phospho-acceptor domain-containing protein, partial [Clostridium sp.]
MRRRLLKAKRALRGLFLTMLRNYIIFTITMFFIIFIGVGYTFARVIMTISNDEYMDEAYRNYTASSIVKDGYENINADKIVAIGGWVEFLDENKNLTDVMGLKMDTKINYTDEDLIDVANESYGNIKQGNGVYASVATFKRDGNVNYCIVKIPVEMVEMSFSIIKVEDDYAEKLGKHIAMVMFVIVPIFLVIAIFLYSLITSRNIIKPMKLIKKGIKKMTSGDYSTRIYFQGNNELSEIKDALNFMAEKIEITQGERERSEKLRTQLLMDISHDLKTPITSISGYSKALYDDVVLEEEKKRRYLKIIYDKSLRVTSLIENLHELTKLDSDGYEVVKESQDIGELLREIVAGFYREIEEG